MDMNIPSPSPTTFGINIISPSVELLNPTPTYDTYKIIERCGRVCYKSDDKFDIDVEPAERMIRSLIKSGHTSVLEHAKATVLITCDRGVTHELVRHRIASYSQESSRFCNYSKDRFGNSLTFIKPCYLEEGTPLFAVWAEGCKKAAFGYFSMLELGAKPEEARALLPNSIKAEIAVTMNFREWRHFFNLRMIGTTGKPHPQMVEVAAMAFKLMMRYYPVLFEDIAEGTKTKGPHMEENTQRDERYK